MLTQAFIEDLDVRYATDFKTIVRIYVTENELAVYDGMMFLIPSVLASMAIGQWTLCSGGVELKTGFPLKEGTFGVQLEDSNLVEIVDFEDWKEDND
jgi:hypothetical protein